MSIVFRNVKGTALTYTEMDRNQAQFFYSASVAAGALKLHYTGSSILNSEGQTDYEPRFVEVPLGSGDSTLNLVEGPGIDIYNDSDGNTVIENTGNASPGEPLHSIQFNKNSSFAGDTVFLYNSDSKRVGLGLSSTISIDRRLHIVGAASQGAIIRLQSFFDINSNNIGGVDETAFLEISSGGVSTRANPDNIFGKFGKVDQVGDPQLHINRYFSDGKTYFSFGPDHTVSHTVLPSGIAINATDTKRDLAVVGEEGIGIGLNQDDLENRIRPILNGIWDRSFVQIGVTGTPPLNVIRKGLAIHSPMNQDDGGNMIIAISDNRDGVFSNNGRHPNRLLINSYTGGDNMKLEASPTSHIASFLSDGTVGIGIPNPNTEIRLDINGQYRGAYTTTEEITKLDFKTYSVIKFIPRQGSEGPYTLRDTIIPPEGTKAVLILGTNEVDYTVIFAEDERLITGKAIPTKPGQHSTITFVSDGRYLIETSRTVNMA